MMNLSRNERRKQAHLLKQQRTADALFRTERDTILRALSVEQMTAFMIKWKQPIHKSWGRPDAALAIMHRARLALSVFTYEEKLLSAKWLMAFGYELPVGMIVRDGKLYGVHNDPRLSNESN